MSKKPRGKSGSTSGPAKWEQGLLAAPLEEESWRFTMALLVGKEHEDTIHLDMLIHAVKSGARKKFSFIQREALYQEVLEIVNPKNKKTKESPQNADICETVKPYLDNDEELPLPLLARLIKFKLLYIKQLDQARIATEKKAAADKTKGVDAKGAKGGKEKPKSAGKKGKGKTPEQPSAKQGSKLKKRGEEDEKTFIDDEPDDGPEHYVILCGFNNPHLVTHLADINVFIDSIIQISSEDYARYKTKPIHGDAPAVKDDKTLAAEEHAREKIARERRDLAQFWQDILALLQQSQDTSRLQDVVRHESTVSSDIIPNNLDDDKDGSKKLQYGMGVYEKVACTMYDTIDLKRQHTTFLQSMKLLHVPVGIETKAEIIPVPPPAHAGSKGAATAPEVLASTTDLSLLPTTGPASVDMRYYSDLMNSVPQESASVPLILHCMLDQIDATEKAQEPPSECSPPARSDGLEHTLASYIGALVVKLSLDADERTRLESVFDTQRPPIPQNKQPKLVHPADNIALRTDHLKTTYGFNAKEAELGMLSRLPFFHITQSLKEASQQKSLDRAARLQELLHFCVSENVSAADVDHALKQFVFECMELASTSDEDGYIEQIVPCDLDRVAAQTIPWDDPYPHYKGMIVAQNPPVALPQKTKASSVPAVIDPLRRGENGDGSDIEDVFGNSLSSPELSRPSSAKLSHSNDPPHSPATLKRAPSESGSGSRPPTPGILKKGDSKGGSKSSVHFDGDGSERSDDLDASKGFKDNDENTKMASSHEPMSMEELVPAAHRRNLDSWHYGELLEPHVLLQIIKDASYVLPFMNVYHNKRDQSLFVVLNNPHDSELKNCFNWHDELHSNVGLRNYLEHVKDLIASWTIAEEARYQGGLLRGDVDKMVEDERQIALAAAKSAKRSRSKSPRSRKGSAQSRSPALDDKVKSYITDRFVMNDSLKAVKEETLRLQAERDEEERLRAEKAADKRTKSAKSKQSSANVKGKAAAAVKKEEEKKTVSRSSSKSRPSKHDDPAVTAELLAVPKLPEKHWPFIGYDMGNKFVHASGNVSTLFPSDGSIIRTEVLDFVQGSTSVKTSVIKDGNVFTVHIRDPQPAASGTSSITVQEKADTESLEKQANNSDKMIKMNGAGKPTEAFGSFSASLADGMSLSFSVHGATGVPKSYKRYEPVPYAAPAPRSPSPGTVASDKKDQSPTKKSKDKGKEKGGLAATPEPPAPQEEELSKDLIPEALPEFPFNELYLTCPDGLAVQFVPESHLGVISPHEPLSSTSTTKERLQRLAVRQTYAFKTFGKHQCEEARRRPAMEEASRIIRADGTVIKTMQDGTTQVLFATGAVTVMSGLAVGSGGSGGGGSSTRSDSPYRTNSARSKTGADRDPSPGKGKVTVQGRKDAKQQASTDDLNVSAEDASDQKKSQWITTSPSGERFGGKADGSSFQVQDVFASLATDPESMQVLLAREDHVMVVTMPNGTQITEHADGTRISTFTKDFSYPGEAYGVPDDVLITHKFVRIECPGYATVEFNVDTGQCVTHFGSSTVVSVVPDGTYAVYYRSQFIVHVLTDGKALYIPEPHSHLISRSFDGDTHSFQQYVSHCDDRAYVMNHSDDVICQTTDPYGNAFIVRHDGTFEVERALHCESETPELHGSEHTARYFVIKFDGSGSELLRHCDVLQAVLDEQPGVAVVREPVFNYPGVESITVMKPYEKNFSEQWLMSYSTDNLVPPGLRSRDLALLPAKEVKIAGPKFGTTLGKGLAVGSAPKASPPSEPVRCPATLQLRRFIQHEPLTDVTRQRLCQGLKDYADFACQREEARRELLPKDPRDTDEQLLAAADALVATAVAQGLASRLDVRSVYEMTLAPRIPSPPPRPQPKRMPADWERDRRELAEEATARGALHRHDVPPFYASELGKGYLIAKAEALSSSQKGVNSDSGQRGQTLESLQPAQKQELQTKEQTQKKAKQIQTQLPFEAASHPPFNVQQRGNVDKSSAARSVRPLNPTPAHAAVLGQTAGHHMPVSVVGKSLTQPMQGFVEQPLEEGSSSSTGGAQVYVDLAGNSSSSGSKILSTNSLLYDVTMKPRHEPVHVPAYLTKSGKPGAYPNTLFEQVESGHRRQVKTSSVAPKVMESSQTRPARGFELLPEAVYFGILKEGCTYNCMVVLRNVGIDTCRYKLRQPPPSTGLRVIYTPGPIAAGMKAELNLELYAIAVGVEGVMGAGTIAHDLEVVTETDVMYLPIKAIVLTCEEYDRQAQTNQEFGKVQRSAGVKYITDRPPNELGIVRPRKDLKVADNQSNAVLSFAK